MLPKLNSIPRLSHLIIVGVELALAGLLVAFTDVTALRYIGYIWILSIFCLDIPLLVRYTMKRAAAKN